MTALVFRILIVVFATTTAMAAAIDDRLQSLEKRVEELQKALDLRTQALTDEFGTLKTKMALPVKADQSYAGLGLGASKVYYSQSPLSIGGYGEMIYENVQGSKADKTDVLRYVPYIGYRFSDKIIFNSELEIEHAGVFGKTSTLTDSGGDTVSVSQPAGEVLIEFAYFDFLGSEALNLRVGHVLVPVGLTNLQHEPVLFPTVSRPETERNIIPTTWHENGALLYGTVNKFNYNVGIVSGLKASSFVGSSWIRSGRQKSAEAEALHWAGVGRLDYEPNDWLSVGTSYYQGKSAQTTSAIVNGTVTIIEGHVTAEKDGVKFNALYAQGQLDDTKAIFNSNGRVIGKEAMGYFLNLSYNLYQHLRPESQEQMRVFAQYEEYDPHSKVEDGLTRDRTLRRERTTVGLNYFPIDNLVTKLSYQFRDRSNGLENDTVELGLGFVF